MSPRFTIPCALILTIIASGCRDVVTIERPAPARARLTVKNERRFPIELRSAEDRDEYQLLSSSDAALIEFDLFPARYLLACTTPKGLLLLPAPMPFEDGRHPLEINVADAERIVSLADDPDFAPIPAGPALIGDILGIGQADERPAHIVDLPAFSIARRETTVAEYVAFLNAVDRVDDGWLAFDSKKSKITKDVDGKFETSSPNEPVVTVSLRGAVAYTEWKTRTTGVVHRLPTEREWEKAARGPYSWTYDYGNVYARESANQESGRIRDVGTFSASPWGIYDLTGNVFEWMSEPYDRFGHIRPFLASMLFPRPGEFALLRGGSFVLDGMYLRNSFRMRQRADVRTDDFGFRVVREIKSEMKP